MDKPEQAWMVRAGNDNTLIEDVEEKGAVAIGWPKVGKLSDLSTRAEVKKRYRERHPEDSDNRVAVNAGQLYRFMAKIQQGDYVLTYDKSEREILVGHVTGDYHEAPEVFGERYPRVRSVEWIKRIPRDNFSPSARNSLGSSLTVFRVNNHLAEIHKLTTGEKQPEEVEEEEEAPPFVDEVKAQSDELIADRISELDWHDFQDLVAGTLEALGFTAVSSSPGPDKGVDVVAHPDALGFEDPHIKVQVKHRKGKAGGPGVREFLGTLKGEERGLYVSTGGFTSDARHAAEGARQRVTLLDRDDFIQLLLDNYESLESEFKGMVPLRKVWVPSES